jgi:hypothetical protein
MKANSPASYRLSIPYHRPENVGGRSSATPSLASRNSPLQLQTHIGTAKVFSRRFSGEDFAKRKARIYGVGEASAGDSVVPPVDVDVEDSVVEAGLVASVVAGGLVAAGVAAGSVVSVFCSHAARSAALARMQMYFFIVLIGRGILL